MSDSIKQLLAISLFSMLIFAGCNQENLQANTNNLNVGQNSLSQSTTEPSVRVYQNGSYFAEGEYISPGGRELVKVTMVLKDDLVQSLDLDVSTENRTSQRYKGLFKAGINDLVIGKPLAEIEGFAQVNGSSLTPKGFQMALEKIKDEAAEESN